MKNSKLLVMGAVAGLFNGLLGAGGGMIVVPMLQKNGLSAERSHATSIAIIFPLCLASGISYLSLGHTTLGVAAQFMPFGLAGAAVGGWLLPRMKPEWLHRIFGVLVLYSAVRLVLQ